MNKFEILISLFLGLVLILCHFGSVSAHDFYNNKDSILFSLVKQFEVEQNLASKDFQTHSAASAQHSHDAYRLLKQISSLKSDLQDETKIVEHSNKLFSELNLTTKALVAANLADQSLKEYGFAHGLDNKTASRLLNMSMGMMMNMPMPSMNKTDGIPIKNNDTLYIRGGKNSTSPIQVSNFITNNITSQVNYESSIMLAKTLKNIFSDNLQHVTLNDSMGLMPIPIEMKKVAVDDLSRGIENLVVAISEKRSLEEVSSILHGQIHPNLFLAYDLKLRAE